MENRKTAKLKITKKYVNDNCAETYVLDLGFCKLLVEICNTDESKAVSVFLANDNGRLQDLVLARKSETLKNAIECLIWSDENYKNNTHKFDIKIVEAFDE